MSLPGKTYRKHSIRGWAHTHTFRLCQSTWYHPGFDLLSKFPKQLQLFWNYHWKNMPTCEKFTHVDPSFHKQLVQSKTNPSCEDNEGFLLQLSRHPIFHCTIRMGGRVDFWLQGVFFTWTKLSTYSKPGPLMDRNSKDWRSQPPSFQGRTVSLREGHGGRENPYHPL